MPRAMSRSFCVRPSAECVVSVSRTLFQPWTRMSGWWLASSASVGHAVDERHRRREVHLNSRTIASPSRRHVEPCRPCSISSSVSLSAMRIVSLVPSATEMLFALGLGEDVTAVTHECDYPPQARDLPKVTRDVIGPGLAAGRDRPRRARADRAGPGDLRARRGRRCARAAARPDRHAGAVRRLRGLLRRRARDRRADGPGARGRLAGPAHARRGARRRAHARAGHRRQGRRRRPRPGRRRADRPRPARRARRAAPVARRRARVAGPDLRRRPLDAAADRVRRRRRPARPARRALRAALVGGGRGRRSPRSCRDAVRLRRRARAPRRPTSYADELDALGAERDRRRRRLRLVLPPRPAPGRRPGAARRTCCTRTALPEAPAGRCVEIAL